MYCYNCGTKIVENSGFCPYCGAPVRIDPREKRKNNDKPESQSDGIEDTVEKEYYRKDSGRDGKERTDGYSKKKIFTIIFIIVLLCIVIYLAYYIVMNYSSIGKPVGKWRVTESGYNEKYESEINDDSYSLMNMYYGVLLMGFSEGTVVEFKNDGTLTIGGIKMDYELDGNDLVIESTYDIECEWNDTLMEWRFADNHYLVHFEKVK